MRICIVLLAVSAQIGDAHGRVAEVPNQFNVGEVPKDGRIVHNRLTFDCHHAGPRTIDCTIVQQDLSDPPPITAKDRGAWMKALSGPDFMQQACAPDKARPDDSKELVTLRQALKGACDRKDADAVRAALLPVYERDASTCKLLTVVHHATFTQIDKETWVEEPDGLSCVTHTIRRAKNWSDRWNYTESKIAKPNPSLREECKSISGTSTFTWDQAVTASEIRCRYLLM